MLTTNIDLDTGIRYGVVYMNSLEDWVWEEFVDNGTNLSVSLARTNFIIEFTAERGRAPTDAEIDEFFECDYYCEEEEYELEVDAEAPFEGKTMKLGLSYLGGAPMVWVFESPYTTEAALCSPCVPNAGNLDTPRPESGGFTTYTLPDDWFRGEEG